MAAWKPHNLWLVRLPMAALLGAGAAGAQTATLGLGRAATPAEIQAADISVSPSGVNLPPGGGTAAQGADVYQRRCQRCHGAKGEGGEEGPALAGGQGSLATPKPLKTVGSYWPHATTLFDYTRRAMPFNQPGILSNDQVYAVTAHILHLNGLFPAGERLDAQSLLKVKMPNRDGFIPDDRPDTGKSAKKAKR